MSRQQDEQKVMNDMQGGNKEKTTSVKKYDTAAVQQRMTQLRSELAKQKEEEKKQLEVILSREVSEADVKVVAEALDVEEAAAKRLLQEHKGDVTAVLREAVHLPQKKG